MSFPPWPFLALIAIIIFSPQQRFDDVIITIKRAKRTNLLISSVVLLLILVGSAISFSLSAYYYLFPMPAMVFITARLHVMNPTRLKETAGVLLLCKPVLIAIGVIATLIGFNALLVILYMVGSSWSVDCSSPPGCDLGGGRGYAFAFAALGGIVVFTSLSLLILVVSIARGAPAEKGQGIPYDTEG